MLLKELRTDLTIEKQILSAMIISEPFSKRFADLINPIFFENLYIRTIAKWILDYYKNHDKIPPKMTIKDILDAKVANKEVEEKEIKLIEPIITDIISLATVLPEFDHDYHIQTAENYFSKRNLIIKANQVLELAEHDQIGEAEKVISDYHKIAVEVSSIFNPFDDDEIHDTFDDDEAPFFQFSGEWGKYCGPFDRGQLVGIQGAFKRGKTWLLQEFVVEALLQKRRIFFVSLEMTKKEIKKRLYQRLTSTGIKSQYIVPVFDCTWNQRHTCELKQNTNPADFPIVDGDNCTIPYDKNLTDYRICTHCRNHPRLFKNFHPSVWYDTITRPRFDRHHIVDESVSWKMFHQFVRYQVFPRFSANISDIERHIGLLVNSEGFVPDIILIDYGDILKGEDSRLEGYTKEDVTWMAMARLASKLNCLVVSPTQVNKEGQTTKNLSVKHQSKWVGIFAHVDMMFAINQTPVEKRAGIIRWGTQAHRHKEFDESTQLTILQSLGLGQPYLDAAVITPVNEEENDEFED